MNKSDILQLGHVPLKLEAGAVLTEELTVAILVQELEVLEDVLPAVVGAAATLEAVVGEELVGFLGSGDSSVFR